MPAERTIDLLPPSLLPPGTTIPDDVDELLPILQAYDSAPAPIEEQLLQRMDFKFELPRRQLPLLLSQLAGSRLLLRSAGRVIATYATLYFDTPERRFLADHLRGRRPRHKVRVRHYIDRHLSFLEVKSKLPSNRTTKIRRARPFGGNGLSEEERRWVERQVGEVGVVAPCGWTGCQRVTLLGRQERMTIDLNVTVGTRTAARALPHLALVELKQPGLSHDHQVLRALRACGARELKLSKYVAAMQTEQAAPSRARFAAVLDRYARPEMWGACCA